MSLLTADPSRIDPEWMTRALREARVIDDVKVIDLVCKPVGNGLVGDSYRFHLTYDGDEPNAPASVVGKFPAADPDSRRSGSAHTLYIREVAFYRELAATVDIHTPRPILAEIDAATDDFTLILEDLARGGDDSGRVEGFRHAQVQDVAVLRIEVCGGYPVRPAAFVGERRKIVRRAAGFDDPVEELPDLLPEATRGQRGGQVLRPRKFKTRPGVPLQQFLDDEVLFRPREQLGRPLQRQHALGFGSPDQVESV